jgi:hypothetical protein
VKFLFCLIALGVTAFSQALPTAMFDAPKLDASVVTYKGKAATRLVDRDGQGGIALVKAPAFAAPFHNGAIEVDVAGQPAAGSFADARGFVGIAFRVQGDGAKYELIYLRPTNGRADDMLRRNHSTQYEAEPEWPWSRLRSESPGVYESYVDLETGAWTRYRIVVKGTRAELYVNGATQPCLIVKDLKLGDATGGIALWIGPGTEAWFAGLKMVREP